jgi:hypothetical protein
MTFSETFLTSQKKVNLTSSPHPSVGSSFEETGRLSLPSRSTEEVSQKETVNLVCLQSCHFPGSMYFSSVSRPRLYSITRIFPFTFRSMCRANYASHKTGNVYRTRMKMYTGDNY